MKLITMVEVSNADEEDEDKIAKLLTVSFSFAYNSPILKLIIQISYIISPILAFTVVGSLRASVSAIGN
jgi:hypothetical protein